MSQVRFLIFAPPEGKASRWGDCPEVNLKQQPRFIGEVVVVRAETDLIGGSDIFDLTIDQYEARFGEVEKHFWEAPDAQAD